MRVEVANKTVTHSLDPDALKTEIVREINSHSKPVPLQAVADGDADCVLTLDIVKEDGYQIDAKYQRVYSDEKAVRLGFQATVSAQLTSRNGQVRWSDPSWKLWQGASLSEMKRKRVSLAWDDPGFRAAFFTRQFFSETALRFVVDLLYK